MRYSPFIIILISLIFVSCSSCKKMNDVNELSENQSKKISFLTNIDQLPQGTVQIIANIDENSISNENKHIDAVISRVIKQGPNAPFVNAGEKIVLNFSDDLDLSKISDASQILVRKLNGSKKNTKNNSWQVISFE